MPQLNLQFSYNLESRVMNKEAGPITVGIYTIAELERKQLLT